MGARFSSPVQTGHGAHPAPYIISTGSLLGVKRPWRGVDHPPPSSVKKEYGYTSTPPLGLRGLFYSELLYHNSFFLRVNFFTRKYGISQHLFFLPQVRVMTSIQAFVSYIRIYVFCKKFIIFMLFYDVKSLTLRLLMSYIYIYIYIYIYGAPILDVSRSHTTTHHSR